MFLPTVIPARTDSQTGFIRTFGGYDSARRSGQFEAIADLTIIGPLAARVGVLYANRPNSFRPTAGLRVAILNQERQEIDLGAGVYYKPEGFTEPEGEIEVVVALGRRFGRLGTFANLVYGQDPEGKERDGEVRLGALYSLATRLQAGLDARLRFELGEEESKAEELAKGRAEFDLVFGPTASYAIGPVAVLGQVGMSIFGSEPARFGAVVLLGAAGVL